MLKATVHAQTAVPTSQVFVSKLPLLSPKHIHDKFMLNCLTSPSSLSLMILNLSLSASLHRVGQAVGGASGRDAAAEHAQERGSEPEAVPLG